jgi:hypothetical protein
MHHRPWKSKCKPNQISVEGKNIKIRVEINEMEMKEQYKGSMKQRTGSLKR